MRITLPPMTRRGYRRGDGLHGRGVPTGAEGAAGDGGDAEDAEPRGPPGSNGPYTGHFHTSLYISIVNLHTKQTSDMKMALSPAARRVSTGRRRNTSGSSWTTSSREAAIRNPHAPKSVRRRAPGRDARAAPRGLSDRGQRRSLAVLDVAARRGAEYGGDAES
jgi:hypothetical protein